MRDALVDQAPSVDLLDDEPLDIELASTVLYEHCQYSYRQIRRGVAEISEARRREIIDAGLRHRGRHDEMLRPFRAGQQFRFDILMDIGGFRDMHRHRRCVQIEQPFTTQHGYEIPTELEPAGALDTYKTTMELTSSAVQALGNSTAPEAIENSQYAIPL